MSHARTACSSPGTTPSLGVGAAARELEDDEDDEDEDEDEDGKGLERDDDEAVDAMAGRSPEWSVRLVLDEGEDPEIAK